MPTKAEVARINKLRALRAQAIKAGYTNEQLDAALAKLYGKSRAPAKPK